MNKAQSYVLEQVRKRHPNGVLISKCWPPTVTAAERQDYIDAAKALVNAGHLAYEQANECYYLPKGGVPKSLETAGRTSRDLRDSLFMLLDEIRAGRVDAKQAQSAINCASTILKAAEVELHALELASQNGVDLERMGLLQLGSEKP